MNASRIIGSLVTGALVVSRVRELFLSSGFLHETPHAFNTALCSPGVLEVVGNVNALPAGKLAHGAWEQPWVATVLARRPTMHSWPPTQPSLPKRQLACPSRQAALWPVAS